jgi:hypothetical protein
MLRGVSICVFIFFFTSNETKSQKLFGIDFTNNWSTAKTQFYNSGFTSKVNSNVMLLDYKNEILNDVYSYQFMFHSIYGTPNLLSYYKQLVDSIESQYGIPSENIKREAAYTTNNDFYYKVSNKDIQYYSKWNKSSLRNYIIQCEIKSDGNIYITLTDSSRYKTKKEILEQEEMRIKRETELEESRIKIETAEKLRKTKLLMSRLSSQGIAIIDYQAFDVSDVTEGTGFEIRLFNPTKKTIKYVSISFYGINPVGDKVQVEFKNTYINKVKCVGPIKPFEGAEYNFEYQWFNDLVQSVKLVSLNIQYMDGSIRNYSDFKNIILNEDEIELLNDFQ